MKNNTRKITYSLLTNEIYGISGNYTRYYKKKLFTREIKELTLISLSTFSLMLIWLNIII